MKIFLAKFLPRLIYPLGFSCILLLVALIRSFAWDLQTALLGTALLVLWLSGNHWFMLWLMRSLEWRHFPPDPIPEADVIVVLGGGTRSATDPRLQVEMNEGGDRILLAANLYLEAKAPHILLTGGEISWMDTGAVEAENMAAVLERFDVPRSAMWLESNARSTYENAEFSKKILAEKGVNRVLLITSAVHMPRALAIFRRQGIDAIPVPADYLVTYIRWQHMKRAGLRAQLIYLLPTANDLRHSSEAVKEYVGLLLLKLQSWSE